MNSTDINSLLCPDINFASTQKQILPLRYNSILGETLKSNLTGLPCVLENMENKRRSIMSWKFLCCPRKLCRSSVVNRPLSQVTWYGNS